MGESKNFLIIGANGLIGQALAREVDGKYDWKGTYFRRLSAPYLKCNIMDFRDVVSTLDSVKPTHVVCCANLAGGVNFCEKNPDLAKRFHFEGIVNLGKSCLEHHAKLVFLSSECVFDGKKEIYREDDHPNPLNIYGKWKAESEQWICKHLTDFTIIRTMFVFGWQPDTVTPNALMKAYFSISKKEKIYVPAFRWGNPTYVHDLAKAIVELSLSQKNDVYHVAGRSYLSRYEWIKKACDILGWDSSWVYSQDRTPKNPPVYSQRICFDTEKFHSQHKTKLHSLDEALAMLKDEIDQTAPCVH